MCFHIYLKKDELTYHSIMSLEYVNLLDFLEQFRTRINLKLKPFRKAKSHAIEN